MVALNHALMIPGLIIVGVLFWAWLPIALLFCCLRRAGNVKNDEKLLESGHLPHPGYEAPPPHAEAAHGQHNRSYRRTMGKRSLRSKRETRGGEHRYGKDTLDQQTDDDRRRERKGKEREHRERRESDEGRREKGKQRAHGSSFGEDQDESPLVRPKNLVTRESSRQRSLMQESRGYPSQDWF